MVKKSKPHHDLKLPGLPATIKIIDSLKEKPLEMADLI